MTKRTPKDRLTIYRRHAGCEVDSPRILDKCECVLWVHGKVKGKFLRRSLDTRALGIAEAKRNALLHGESPEPPTGGDGPKLVGLGRKLNTATLTLADAIVKFEADKASKAQSTIKLYRTTLASFLLFCNAHRIELLRVIDTDVVQAFLRENESRWRGHTRVIKLKHLRTFFRYAIAEKWLTDSPAANKKLSYASPTSSDRKPFSPQEIEKIIKAVDRIEDSALRIQARALVFLLLSTGMRISDAAFCERDYLDAKAQEMRYMVIKTGRQIELAPWISQEVIAALEALPKSRVYFFQPDRDDDYADARRALRSGEEQFAACLPGGPKARYFTRARDRLASIVHLVLRLAGLRQEKRKEAAVGRQRQKRVYTGLCHRFRDTFAINLLTEGVDVFTVSQFLGHTDVKITIRHYLKLVPGYAEKMSKKTQVLKFPFAFAA